MRVLSGASGRWCVFQPKRKGEGRARRAGRASVSLGDRWIAASRLPDRSGVQAGARNDAVRAFRRTATACSTCRECVDWVRLVHPQYYAASPARSPTDRARGTLRLLRGGSWVGRRRPHALVQPSPTRFRPIHTRTGSGSGGVFTIGRTGASRQDANHQRDREVFRVTPAVLLEHTGPLRRPSSGRAKHACFAGRPCRRHRRRGRREARAGPRLVSVAAESRAESARGAARQRRPRWRRAGEAQVLGLPADAIRTSDTICSGIRLCERQTDPPRLRCAHNVEVRVDDLARVGRIVDSAVGSGATSVAASASI